MKKPLLVLVVMLMIPVSASSAQRSPDPCGKLKAVPLAHSHLCTHGPDAAPTAIEINRAEVALGEPSAPAPCVKRASETDFTGGRRIRVLYGVPSDRTPSSTNRALIPRWLAHASDTLRASGGNQEYRFYCTGSPASVAITKVTLDPIGADGLYTYEDLAASMTRLGFTNKNVDYAVFVDKLSGAYPYSGQGSLESDTQPEPALNDNNDASVGKLAFIKLDPASEDYHALAFMHEVGHNLGAVQVNTPHASGGSHCFDEYDTMCYNDGGTYFTDGGVLRYLCPTEVAPTSIWDCGKDDYYNATKVVVNPSGSYLAANWNLARSSWLSPVVGGPPVVTTPMFAFAGGAVTSTKTIKVTAKWMASDSDEIASQQLQMQTDGGPWVNIAISASARSYKRAIRFPSGPYNFRVRATDAEGNVSAWAKGAPFSLTQPTPTYSGTWNTATNSNYVDGSTRYSTTQGYAALKTFTGRAFAWVGSKGPAFGTSTVATDGVGISKTQQASTNKYRMVIQRSGWGVTGSHSVWVNCDATSGHPRCDADTFVVMI
ncbi:MAG: hypothetical protein WD739_14185 [Actinomycetota bacterium]